MARVYPGRYTARKEGPFVVFLIGMRVNRFWALRKWVPTAMAMGPMLRELYSHPEKGFLGTQISLAWRGVTLIQYWRSFEDLERFARAKDDPHFPAWQRFNRVIGGDGSVGIWHETYQVPAGGYECVYANMPSHGLAAASEHVPVSGSYHTARGRLGMEATADAASTDVHLPI
jgi:hypothetical protein